MGFWQAPERCLPILPAARSRAGHEPDPFSCTRSGRCRRSAPAIRRPAPRCWRRKAPRTATETETPLQYLGNLFPKATNKELRRHLSLAGLVNQLAQEPIKDLSGGEQTKVKLAQMTMTPGNFLILDEPTNHIDQEAKESLRESLANYEGTVIVVSHEQDFYEDFVDRIIEMEG